MKKLLLLSCAFVASTLLNATEKTTMKVNSEKMGSICRNAFVAYLQACKANFEGKEDIENILCVCEEMDGNNPLLYRTRAEEFQRLNLNLVAANDMYRFEDQSSK